MAATIEGAQLTASYLEAQTQLRSALVGQLRRLWPALNPEDLLGTFPAWESAVSTLVQQWFGTSAGLGSAYVKRFSAVESENARAAQVFLPEALPADQLVTSLRVTGPIAIARLLEDGRDVTKAADTAFVLHAGAASRLMLAGGRQTLAATIEQDRRVRAYARVTASNPCAFCAMLASRGPVFRTEHAALFARSGARYHDHCVCFAEPVYRAGVEWPGRAREFQQLWHESTKGTFGADAVRAFRHAFEAA